MSQTYVSSFRASHRLVQKKVISTSGLFNQLVKWIPCLCPSTKDTLTDEKYIVVLCNVVKKKVIEMESFPPSKHSSPKPELHSGECKLAPVQCSAVKKGLILPTERLL